MPRPLGERSGPSREPSRGEPRSRSSSRGGGGGRYPRGGGEPNRTALYSILAVAGLGIVVLVILLATKGPKNSPPPTASPTIQPSTPKTTAAAAPTVSEKPYPPMPPEKFEEARRLSSSFQEDANRADALYAESLQAKKSGDDATWQRKLKDAKALYDGINDKWNEFIASLPKNRDHDEEDVVRHFFQKENGRVAEYTKNLRSMKADER